MSLLCEVSLMSIEHYSNEKASQQTIPSLLHN